MLQKHPIQLAARLAVLLSALLPALQLAAEEPNVIVIISDDQGWADIGYNNPKVYSPNLDKLANSGTN